MSEDEPIIPDKKGKKIFLQTSIPKLQSKNDDKEETKNYEEELMLQHEPIIPSINDIKPEDLLIVLSDPEVKEGLKKYVTYKVSGKYIREPVYRRFSDFFSLRIKLLERWPGLYIPNVPPKKAVGNLEKEIIQTRMRLLNIFCYKLSQVKPIVESEEVKVFFMSNVDASTAVDALPPLSYGEILARYQRGFPQYANENYDAVAGKEKIIEFHSFLKKAIINLTNFNEVVQQTMQKKDLEIENYLTLIHVFEDYEKYTLMEYTDNDEGRLVFFNPKNTELCEKIMKLRQNLKNPYIPLMKWLEDEVLDVEAMEEALSSLLNMIEVSEKSIQDIETIDQRIKNLEDGYGSIKLMITFKNKDTVLNDLKERRNVLQSTSSTLIQIIKIASLSLDSYLDFFKIEKLEMFYNNLRAFSELQKDNNNILNDLWECVAKDRNLFANIANYSTYNNNKQDKD